MGWTYQHREKGMSNDEFFSAEFPSVEILASSTKNKTYYAAARNRSKPDEVFALVILTNWAPRDHFNFGYKDMDETMGPNEAEAPAKVLDLLTETDHEYASEWRNACRANLAKMAAKAKVKPGDTVKFAHPIRFTNGQSLDTFQFVKRSTFKNGYRTFMLGAQWKARDYEVIK